MNKYKVTILIIGLISFISLPVFAFSRVNVNDVEKALENNKVKKSVSLYNKLVNREKDRGSEMLLDYAAVVNENVEKGLEDTNTALEKINYMHSVSDINKEIIEIKGQITGIEQSQLAFIRGERAEEEGNYKKALEEYYKVIKRDKKNYYIARRRAESIKNILELGEK